MTIDEVLKYFGNQYQFGKKTKMSINSLKNWKVRGYIPIASQVKLELFTKGVLRARFEDLVKHDV